MLHQWITEGTEGWWKAHGWREVRRAKALHGDFTEILMEHDEVEEDE